MKMNESITDKRITTESRGRTERQMNDELGRGRKDDEKKEEQGDWIQSNLICFSLNY